MRLVGSDPEGTYMLLLLVCIYLCIFRTNVYRYVTQIALSVQKQQELQRHALVQDFVTIAIKQHKDATQQHKDSNNSIVV